MEIIKYDENKEVLSVKFNTEIVWKYNKITAEAFKRIQESEFPDKLIRKILHEVNSVGISKEDI